MRPGEIVVSHIAAHPESGFVDIQGTGATIYKKSAALSSNLTPFAPVLSIRGPGRSIIVLGMGGYASALPGE